MKYLLTVVLIAFAIAVQAQKDAPPANKRDSTILARFLEKGYHPLIKGSNRAAVIPVKNVTEVPDPKMQYKLLFEDIAGNKDSTAATYINGGLAEIGRLINLHIASGIPKKNLHLVAVLHGPSLFTLLNNEQYQKKYHTDNPNIALLNELMQNGVRFIACGQAMSIQNIQPGDFVPGVKVSLTAQTVLSNYQLKGYVYYFINGE